MEWNSHKSTWKLALNLNTSQSTICYHLKKIRKVSWLSIWLPYTLSEKNKEDCITVVTSLLSRQRNNLFLKTIITDDKKMGLFMTMFNTKAVNWQGWISAAYLEGRASWIKSYAVWTVGLLQYYWFWVLWTTIILSTATRSAWKSKKTPSTYQWERCCASPW